METLVKMIRRARDSESSALPGQRRAPNLRPLSAAMFPNTLLLTELNCVREAIDRLLQDPQCCALVVNQLGEPVGTFTEQRCLRLLTSAAYRADPGENCRLLRDIMQPDPIIVPEDYDPFALAQMLLARDEELAAVMRNDVLLGAVARRSLLRVLARPEIPQCTPQVRRFCRVERGRP